MTGGGCRRPLELTAHAHAKEGVQGGEQLVEQEYRGVGDERPRERNPLLLPAGELRGHALPVVAHVDEIELFHRNRVALGLRHAPHPQAERDVVQAVQVREQRVVFWNIMAVGRSAGVSPPTSLPSIRIRPALISSWPAIIRRVDVLPHPDGPSRQQ